ncbi:unnamed protein product [Danaus chrysippus]|uniref:(African queen) hypothetical protein n=1 Tax=Danaus chrysippus TaxID=151541 RepID=A0A8J2RJE1_9NEOP|nr:unnamed protein product [Danaus chrysippus]
MSSDENTSDTEVHVDILYIHEVDSSQEPPMSEWSSLELKNPENNIKRLLYEEGVYRPDSGEICAKYIPLSASSILRHPYYTYPGVTDPGIMEALLFPEPLVKYPDDGQQLYLTICDEADISPIRSFYTQLLNDHICLKYYGINQKGFRAIALALNYNKYVTKLDLTDNWINEDGCFHLGEMLLENTTLSELNLHGCRIGPEGAKRLFANLHINRSLSVMNLRKNRLGDIGVQYLAKAILFGASVDNINLSFNDLTGKAVMSLVEAFEINNILTKLDLSWNKILSPNSIFQLCNMLSQNTSFEELNLSWNSLSGVRIGNAIKNLMSNRNVKHVYLNNNKLANVAITPIANGIFMYKNLITLDLSYNPLGPKDALILLLCLKDKKVKLKNLYLDNVYVTKEFLKIRKEIMSLNNRKNTVITWGGVKSRFVPELGDMREIVLNRADALCKKMKKPRVDIALVILQIFKENKEPILVKEFGRALRSNGVCLDEDLLQEFSNCFVGPCKGKSNRTINLVELAEYMERKWPERKLPPTPTN